MKPSGFWPAGVVSERYSPGGLLRGRQRHVGTPSNPQPKSRADRRELLLHARDFGHHVGVGRQAQVTIGTQLPEANLQAKPRQQRLQPRHPTARIGGKDLRRRRVQRQFHRFAGRFGRVVEHADQLLVALPQLFAQRDGLVDLQGIVRIDPERGFNPAHARFFEQTQQIGPSMGIVYARQGPAELAAGDPRPRFDQRQRHFVDMSKTAGSDPLHSHAVQPGRGKFCFPGLRPAARLVVGQRLFAGWVRRALGGRHRLAQGGVQFDLGRWRLLPAGDDAGQQNGLFKRIQRLRVVDVERHARQFAQPDVVERGRAGQVAGALINHGRFQVQADDCDLPP